MGESLIQSISVILKIRATWLKSWLSFLVIKAEEKAERMINRWIRKASFKISQAFLKTQYGKKFPLGWPYVDPWDLLCLVAQLPVQGWVSLGPWGMKAKCGPLKAGQVGREREVKGKRKEKGWYRASTQHIDSSAWSQDYNIIKKNSRTLTSKYSLFHLTFR